MNLKLPRNIKEIDKKELMDLLFYYRQQAYWIDTHDPDRKIYFIAYHILEENITKVRLEFNRRLYKQNIKELKNRTYE